MSAMTGPRHSPSSPWPRESPSHQRASMPAQTPLLSMRDSGSSPQNHNAQPIADPSYFMISVENSGHPPAKPDENTQLQWNQPGFDHAKDTSMPTSGTLGARNDSAGHGFSWGSWSHDSLPSAGKKAPDSYRPAQFSRNTKSDGSSNDNPPISRPSGLPPRNSSSHLRFLQGKQAGEFSMSAGASRYTSSGLSNSASHTSAGQSNGNFVSIERCAELYETQQADIMLLDVRPYAHFVQSHLEGSLNLCIPTTLLKRPSFDTQKLADTFTDDADKRNFSRWKQCRSIIVYDFATFDVKDAAPLLNVLKKFKTEGWNGEGFILRGGFQAFSRRFPSRVTKQRPQDAKSSPKKPTSMHLSLPAAAPVAGGCALPESSSATIPFFGNIRQHMDLLGGVGQIPLQLPDDFTESKRQRLPLWLQEVSDTRDKGHNVSQKFLDLEKTEFERMKQALTYDASAKSAVPQKFRVAGIEKGTKNRYNDIYPFDHSRVRLQGVPSGECDYVNGSHLKAEYSNKSYIATQAPVPDTFNDFWRMVWEQDVRLIVSLTAEVERGQVKCHPYWKSGDYGPLRVNHFSETHVYVNTPGSSGSVKPNVPSPNVGDDFTQKTNEAVGDPCIVVRHFGLLHSSFPFSPLREITQLQYPYWPDFGTTSQPSHLLKLLEQCGHVTRMTSSTPYSTRESEPAGERPMLVHCSAGCGRTGTFCTVDSVMDMLKRQSVRDIMFLPQTEKDDYSDGWIDNEKLDLIAKTVADFRTQRPSMIQNLSQYVLCYESILEWMTSQMDEESRS